MAGVLGLLGQEFKTILINMLRAVLYRADIMHEQIDNVSREIEIQRKNAPAKNATFRKHCNKNEKHL